MHIAAKAASIGIALAVLGGSFVEPLHFLLAMAAFQGPKILQLRVLLALGLKGARMRRLDPAARAIASIVARIVLTCCYPFGHF